MDIRPSPGERYLKEFLLLLAGWLLGVVTSEVRSYRQRKRDAKKDTTDKKQSYNAWLNGLRAELNHIQDVITEITGIIDSGQVPTKRINSDFLEKARLSLPDHDTDTVFMEQLTTAFRDIVHTNGMLDRLEAATRPKPASAAASMIGVKASVDALSDTLDAKLSALKSS